MSRGLAWRRHQRERVIRNRVALYPDVFEPPGYGEPSWMWKRPPWYYWLRDYGTKPLDPGRLDKARCPPTHSNCGWQTEIKSWKMMGRRADKVRRARKLGFEYPRRPLEQGGWEEQVEPEPQVPGDSGQATGGGGQLEPGLEAPPV
jgi:hypothetical protein